jgi:hypothetical protein
MKRKRDRKRASEREREIDGKAKKGGRGKVG